MLRFLSHLSIGILASFLVALLVLLLVCLLLYEEVADALHPKTRSFNQEQYTPRHDYSHAMPTQPCEILKKGA